MVNLAQWQWHRHNERREFNERVEAQQAAPPVPLQSLLGETPADIAWRTVTLTGTFDAGPRFEVVNKSQDGQVGRNVVDHITLDDGPIVLVVRGFIGDGQATPPVPTGEVTLTARVKQGDERSFGQASDDAAAQLTEIRRVDLDVLQSQFEQPLAPVYVEVLASEPADDAALAPIPNPQLTGGPHLSYTAQWTLFSGAVAVGWVLAVRYSARRLSGRGGSGRRGSSVPIDDESATTSTGTPMPSSR
jgi:cytochrome oxidase assembly protein ShyY1